MRVDDSTLVRRFVLTPSFGGHWGQTVWIFRAIAVVTLAVAAPFAWFGFWPILVFATLELAALGWALYASARRALDTEVITVQHAWVSIEKGRERPQRSWCLERFFAEVQLTRPYAASPPRLVIRCRDARVELGRFLNDNERATVAGELRRCIGPVASDGGATSRCLTAADRL